MARNCSLRRNGNGNTHTQLKACQRSEQTTEVFVDFQRVLLQYSVLSCIVNL
ncbi:unnamed protein product [Haemonchus placei]|uniref:Uncharacterized protein n=1 Tax=Haemonchus placei TaxID=6290 RepID=A0A0N4X381_HAEPC|nr:unnamed protein product [Haemonchus placei]